LRPRWSHDQQKITVSNYILLVKTPTRAREAQNKISLYSVVVLMNAVIQKTKSWPVLVLFTSCAVILCLFLFFIDEGNYSFAGLLNPANFIAMSIYFIAAFFGQAAVYALLEFITNKRQPIMSVIIGAPLGAFLLMCVFWFG
jgi:hypothetical protein